MPTTLDQILSLFGGTTDQTTLDDLRRQLATRNSEASSLFALAEAIARDPLALDWSKILEDAIDEDAEAEQRADFEQPPVPDIVVDWSSESVSELAVAIARNPFALDWSALVDDHDPDVVIDLPIRGEWYSRPADTPLAAWVKVCDTPGNVTLRAGEVYHFKASRLARSDELNNLTILHGFGSFQSLDLSTCYLHMRDSTLSTLESLTSLNLGQCHGLMDVSLSNLPALTSLNMSGCDYLTDVSSLSNLPALTSLDLSGCNALTDVSSLSNLTALTSLDLRGCKALTNVSLSNLPALTSLDLSGCKALTDVSSLANLTKLTSLNLSWCEALTDVSSLSNLTALTSLDLIGCKALTDVSSLANLTKLTSLNLSGCEALTDVSSLSNLTALESLNLSWCKALTDISSLSNLPALTSLNLSYCKALKVASVSNLPALTSLSLSGCEALTSVSSLSNLPALTSLNLRGCEALTDVSLAKLLLQLPFEEITLPSDHVLTFGRQPRSAKRARLQREVVTPAPPEGDPPQPVETGDAVDCAVFAPASVQQGQDVFIQVFAFHSGKLAEATRRAREYDDSTSRRGLASLELAIESGQVLEFHLSLNGVEVRDPVRRITWQGRTVSAPYGITVPADRPAGPLIGTVLVSTNGIPVGRIDFKLEVTNAPPRWSLAPVEQEPARFRKAFVSYSSADRAEVLRRVQMLRPPITDVAVFQDVLDLEPGEQWEPILEQRIAECDLFLLFWSNNARQSEWVRREYQLALQRQGTDPQKQPTILPVILEGPPPPAPPAELNHLHFNDYLIYLLSRV